MNVPGVFLRHHARQVYIASGGGTVTSSTLAVRRGRCPLSPSLPPCTPGHAGPQGRQPRGGPEPGGAEQNEADAEEPPRCLHFGAGFCSVAAPPVLVFTSRDGGPAVKSDHGHESVLSAGVVFFEEATRQDHGLVARVPGVQDAHVVRMAFVIDDIRGRSGDQEQPAGRPRERDN
ncbi:hypothetical protein KBY55_19995 [Streptomyces sp. b94]|nr:hypothetical protein [Streptomyces sp. b94]